MTEPMKARDLRLATVALLLPGLGCGEPAAKEPFVCEVTAPTECPSPAPTYADIKPIVARRCSSSSCHSGAAGGPWPLTEYEDIADWWDITRDQLLACTMPPPDSGVVMTSDERMTMLVWLRCGFPR